MDEKTALLKREGQGVRPNDLSVSVQIKKTSKQDEPQEWRGNLPCVCKSQGGCEAHNPEVLHMFHNSRIPQSNQKLGCMERLRRSLLPLSPLEKSGQRGTQITSDLPFDASTLDPLVRLYSTIPFAFAFYHLDWARRNPGATNFVTCRGTSKMQPAKNVSKTPLDWSTQGFWINESFHLKQIANFSIGLEEPKPILSSHIRQVQEVLTPCPHRQMALDMVRFVEQHGSMSATMFYRMKWLGGKFYKFKWESLHGMCRASYKCDRCFMDCVYKIELLNGRVDVHVETYKDLGCGKGRFEGKWLAALRGDSGLERDWSTSCVRRAVFAVDKEGKDRDDELDRRQLAESGSNAYKNIESIDREPGHGGGGGGGGRFPVLHLGPVESSDPRDGPFQMFMFPSGLKIF